MSPSNNFLTLAALEAEKGMTRGHGGPFGAVIVCDGKVIAKAHNTVLQKKDPTCHAEINAIRQAVKKLNSPFLSEGSIYSTTEPCSMCFSAIHWSRLRQVFYCTTIKDVKRLGFNELMISNQKLKKWGRSPVMVKQIKNSTCDLLLKKWCPLSSKKLY